jgi:hypothetical protein
MSKDIKNDMTKDPEDQRRDFPRGSSATGDLKPVEDATDATKPDGAWQPTQAGAAAERQGRTTQEGGAEPQEGGAERTA